MVDPDVLQEIAFIGAVTKMMFGDDTEPFEVAVLHHTGCGGLADPDFRAALRAQHQAFADSAVTDPYESVGHDVNQLLQSPLLPHGIRLGPRLHVATGPCVTTTVPSTEVNR